MTNSHPEPGGWEVIERHKLSTVYEHEDGTKARTSTVHPKGAQLTINGEEIFEVTNTDDWSEYWAKVEAALDGWPDNVEAHNRVGNAGLGDFCD